MPGHMHHAATAGRTAGRRLPVPPSPTHANLGAPPAVPVPSLPSPLCSEQGGWKNKGPTCCPKLFTTLGCPPVTKFPTESPPDFTLGNLNGYTCAQMTKLANAAVSRQWVGAPCVVGFGLVCWV